MILHNFQTLDIYILINPGNIAQYGGRVYIALQTMRRPNSQVNINYPEWPEPGTDPTAWQEIPKDCDNCYCKAMTVKDNGSNTADEIETCPYATAHEDATNQSIPDLCQAWDPIIWPSLSPNLISHVRHLNTSSTPNRDTLIARLKSGRVCRAEMQSILSNLI